MEGYNKREHRAAIKYSRRGTLNSETAQEQGKIHAYNGCSQRATLYYKTDME